MQFEIKPVVKECQQYQQEELTGLAGIAAVAV